MPNEPLSERERRVLEAVVQSYVETAEPVGSRVLARRAGLGVSAATIRNAMSDLEEKGLLSHPHTSAGRVPTDRAYRLYVDSVIRLARPTRAEEDAIREELTAEGSAVGSILRRAAQVLSVLTQELGVAMVPALDDAVLERLELLGVASGRLLLVLTLGGGLVRTIFVEVPGHIHPHAVATIAAILNDRLSGCTLREIRQTLRERVRDSATTQEESELLDIFVSTSEQLFEVPAPGPDDVLFGRPSMLAEQPEFAKGERLRELLALTEQRENLRRVLTERARSFGMTVTIGGENATEQLAHLSLVTAPYHSGTLSGVIGVIGPTRMPYEKVLALVEHTSRFVSELLR